MFSVPTSSFFFPSVVPFTTRASMPMFIVPAACVRVFFSVSAARAFDVTMFVHCADCCVLFFCSLFINAVYSQRVYSVSMFSVTAVLLFLLFFVFSNIRVGYGLVDALAALVQ